VFEQWLGTLPKAGFLTEFYLTRPFSVAQAGTPFVPLLT
jgi:hypothetical protein